MINLGRRNTPHREVLVKENMLKIGIPRLFFNCTIDDYVGEEEIKTVVSRYIDNIHDMFDDCVNLTFYGSNGSGKTFLTSLILRSAYTFRYTAKRVTLKRYIDLKFMPSIQKTEEIWGELNSIDNAEFLVIDEVGSEPNTKNEGSISVFEELMKYREERGLPTIICTNLNLDELLSKYGNTIMSMINQSLKFEMKTGDMRREIFSKRKGVSILLRGE